GDDLDALETAPPDRVAVDDAHLEAFDVARDLGKPPPHGVLGGAGEARGSGGDPGSEPPCPERRRGAVGERPLADARVPAPQARVGGEALGDTTGTLGRPHRALRARLEDHVLDPALLALPAAPHTQSVAP